MTDPVSAAAGGAVGAAHGGGQLSERDWRPPSMKIDTSLASVARMYDYLLGGKDNYEADRVRAEQVAAADPLIRDLVRENRGFVRRAVAYMASECGIDQFIDIGTGLPTAENVHQVAQRANAAARVVYVDNDPIVLVHARALLARDASTTVIQADVRDIDAIVAAPALRELIDFDRPIGVMLAAVLHFVPAADQPRAITDRLRAALPPGSYLGITHGCPENAPDTVGEVVEIYEQTASPGTVRSREEIAAMFGDWPLVDPGLVWLPYWRPDLAHLSKLGRNADKIWFLAALAHHPEPGRSA